MNRREQAAAWAAERERERRESAATEAAEHAEYEAERERKRREREQEITDQVDAILATTADEHLARAARIYATPVSSHEQTPHLLHVLVELGFAVAKGQAGASYSTPPQDQGR